MAIGSVSGGWSSPGVASVRGPASFATPSPGATSSPVPSATPGGSGGSSGDADLLRQLREALLQAVEDLGTEETESEEETGAADGADGRGAAGTGRAEAGGPETEEERMRLDDLLRRIGVDPHAFRHDAKLARAGSGGPRPAAALDGLPSGLTLDASA